MTDVDRRTAFGIAGATLALGACSNGKVNKGESADCRTGPGWLHGQPTYEKRPRDADAALQFDPEYLSIVYMRFGRIGQDRKLLVHHGYRAIPNGSTADAIQRLAEAEMVQARIASAGNWRRTDQPAVHLRREENFESFDFGSQNQMFFMIDHNEDVIKFDDRTEAGVTPARMPNLVRFSPFFGQADQPTIDHSNQAEPNNAFFNAKIVPGLTAPLRNRKILMLENWYTDKKGVPITGQQDMKYSMNIHLLIATDVQKWLPLILDPDTGNVGSKP